jgi:hypothetical protein
MNYTKSQVIEYVNTLVGGSVDYDGWYGAQCVDLIGHIMQKFCGFTPFGNAVDYMSNAMPPGATRHTGAAGIQPVTSFINSEWVHGLYVYFKIVQSYIFQLFRSKVISQRNITYFDV